MAFQKKSIGMTRPVSVPVTADGKNGISVSLPGYEEVLPAGTEKNGRVWDGEKWVSKSVWEASLKG